MAFKGCSHKTTPEEAAILGDPRGDTLNSTWSRVLHSPLHGLCVWFLVILAIPFLHCILFLLFSIGADCFIVAYLAWVLPVGPPWIFQDTSC